MTIGIDPGVEGALALIDGNDVFVCDLPVANVSSTRQVDPVGLWCILRRWHDHGDVVIEDNKAQGRNGSKANFSMGLSMGVVLGVVGSLSLPLVRMRPQEWQRQVGLATVPAAERKEASRMRARELWPQVADQLSRKRDHNRAEALLIAEAHRRRRFQ